jgi:hypothetical protein
MFLIHPLSNPLYPRDKIPYENFEKKTRKHRDMTQKYIGNGTERREKQNTPYLVCFGYQSPYAREMFDVFSENDFFSVNRVITSSKLSPSNLSASNFVYTLSEIDMIFVLIFPTSYNIY